MNSMKMQKDMTFKGELPLSTGEEWRNNSK